MKVIFNTHSLQTFTTTSAGMYTYSICLSTNLSKRNLAFNFHHDFDI